MSDEPESLPDGYFRDASGMLRIKPVVTPAPDIAAILSQLSVEECEARLLGMSHSDLISLVRASLGPSLACFLLTEDETYNAMLKRLACDGLNSKDARDALAAIREWLDRTKGKPLQKQESSVSIQGNSAFGIKPESLKAMMRAYLEREDELAASLIEGTAERL